MPEKATWTRLSAQRKRLASRRFYTLSAGSLDLKLVDADDDPWLVQLPAGWSRNVGTNVTTEVENTRTEKSQRVHVNVIAVVDASKSGHGEWFYALGIETPLINRDLQGKRFPRSRGDRPDRLAERLLRAVGSGV